MATQQDLATQVMGELQLLPAGQVASAADYDTISTRYLQKMLYLQDEDYADWDTSASSSTELIPDAAMPGLIRVMAWEIAPQYNVPRSSLVDPKGQTYEDVGLSLLRRYMRMKPSYESIRAEYF